MLEFFLLYKLFFNCQFSHNSKETKTLKSVSRLSKKDNNKILRDDPSCLPSIFFSLKVSEESLPPPFPHSKNWLRGEPAINLVTLEMIHIYSLCSTPGPYIENKAAASL